jgi:hypothetical protein
MKSSAQEAVMTKFFCRTVGLGLTLLPIGLLSASGAPAGQKESIPQLGFAYYEWTKHDTALRPIAGAGAGPVVEPGGFKDSKQEGRPIRIADLSNPILKPWAIESMRKPNEIAAAGGEAYEAHSSCRPSGVPGFLVSGSGNPMYIIQGPREVLLINEAGPEIRHIYLNVPHSDHLKLSQYGESVGHYEGDTLVVDTVGLSDDTYVDNYRTPHTTHEHVIERFKRVDGGNTLQVDVRVEDPGAFNMPWSGRQIYHGEVARDSFHGSLEGQLLEAICGENNANYFKEQNIGTIPVADKADF